MVGAGGIAVEGGADAQAGGGEMGLPSHPGPAGVDAIGGHDLFGRDLDIGGGNINGVPAPVAVNDRAGDGKGATQIGSGRGDVPGQDGAPDACR